MSYQFKALLVENMPCTFIAQTGKCRAVKNVRLLKLKHSCAQNWIQRITYEGRECNLLDRGKCDINLYELCSIIDDSYYKTKFGPNRPEAIVGRLYNSFAPNEWKYTGDQRKEHKIGRCYPDYTHMQYKAVTEIFGDFYHGEDFTGVPVHINEAKKIKAYDKMKYKCLIVWEHECYDENTLLKKLKKY